MAWSYRLRSYSSFSLSRSFFSSLRFLLLALHYHSSWISCSYSTPLPVLLFPWEKVLSILRLLTRLLRVIANLLSDEGNRRDGFGGYELPPIPSEGKGTVGFAFVNTIVLSHR
jgi:hypothetical protein